MGNSRKILVTGAAGFIGFHLCEKLLDLGHSIVGIDNINDYYDVELKFARLKQLGIKKDCSSKFSNACVGSNENFKFIRMNLEDQKELNSLFEAENFDAICNLAAQAGVRYSLQNPQAYIDSNIQGFMNILECCRHHNVKRLVYASSSSVYGNSDEVPFSENQNVDKPISLYAATKKSNELMAHTYSHLYGIQTIGLRFFTVYGPWGRPDMAMFLFTEAMLNGKPIKVFNEGNLSRDFTYIDDIVEGVVATLLQDSNNNELDQLYNIGNNNPVQLLDFIQAIEKELGIVADKEMLPMQDGDVEKTWADSSALINNYEYQPSTPIEIGVKNFIEWYKSFHVINKSS